MTPQTVDREKIAFIGLGAMGKGMAAKLQQAGLLACVWNRNTAVARDFAAEQQCQQAQSLVEAIAQASMVISCVSADADLLAVLEQTEGQLGSQHLWLDCSTVSATTAKQAAAICGQKDASFMDCPVSGGVEGAKNGQLAFMCGGSAEDYSRATAAMQAMGRRAEHMGPVGSGQATKAVNQIMVAGINQGVTEALAFAKQHELPLDKLLDIVGSGAAGNWYLAHRGKTMLQGQFEPGFKLKLHHKDLAICTAMAAAAGLALPTVEASLADYEQLMAAGYGEEDTSALLRLKLAEQL